MAYTKIRMENPKTGEFREAPVGFSWTVFFFGGFPALFRGDYKNFVIMIGLQMLTASLSNFYYMFSYNKIYIKTLMEKGFKAVPKDDQNIKEISMETGLDIPTIEDEK